MITRTMTTVALAAVLAIGSHQANASDLGGSGCCADLEGRVAELEATTARKGNRKMSLTVSGQVNQAILFHDLSESLTSVPQTSIIGNNELSTSRVRFEGSGKINQDWSAGFVMEFGAGDDISIRHQALYIKSKTVGAIWHGKTSTATDGIAEIDLSNANIAATALNLSPAIDTFAPGVKLVPSFDGGRRELVKWSSATEMPIQLSASISDKDTYDVAIRSTGEVGQFRLAAGVGYRKDQLDVILAPGIEARTLAGSASIMHVPSGIFLSGSAGRIQAMGEEHRGYHGRLGFEQKLSDLGKTTLFAEYGRIEIKGVDDYWGGGIVQAIDPAAMEVYLSGRKYDLDGAAPGVVDDATVIVGGARIRF